MQDKLTCVYAEERAHIVMRGTGLRRAIEEEVRCKRAINTAHTVENAFNRTIRSMSKALIHGRFTVRRSAP